MMTKRFRSCLMSAALLLTAVLLISFFPVPAQAEEVFPTCTEDGYFIYRFPDGTVTRKKSLPALGHDYSGWENDLLTGVCSRVCTVCGEEETVRLKEEGLPRLFLEGNMEGVSKTEQVRLSASLEGAGTDFSCYAFVSLQGHSTLTLDKKNYMLRLYQDAEQTTPMEVRFPGWQPEHKFVLKASYLDPSCVRNLLCADLWRAMTDTRAGFPKRLAQTQLRGAVSGFPVTVWLNGAFLGLYTLNLHKDNDLYGMYRGENAAILIANAQTTDESLFRGSALFQETSDWEVEFCGTSNDEWIRNRLNALIRFVMESDDTTFRARLDEYLDVGGAIDYLLFIYTMGLTRSAAKDLVLLSYGDRLIPTVYDMEDAFGLGPDGLILENEDYFLPQRTASRWDSGTGSLLWDRLMNLYWPELSARYFVLRQNLWTEDVLLSAIDNYCTQIPSAAYGLDASAYPGRMDPQEAQHQMKEYIRRRLKMMDRVIGGQGQ